MSETPPLVSGGFVEVPPPHVPFGGSSDYMRMLREAQGVTSTRTSCRVSPYMSSHQSPKSPPNSPYNERADGAEEETDLSDVYINPLCHRDTRDSEVSDFIWDWSSRPNITPPKQWRLQTSSSASSKPSKTSEVSAKGSGSSSTKIVFTFLLTNVISLLLGAGIGMWIKRKIVKTVI